MKKTSFTVLSFLVSACLCMGNESYSFHQFRASQDGLSFDDVKCIAQDSSSLIWIGTRYGLCRYDGRRFRTYYQDEMHVRSNFVRCIHSAEDGKIWVGTSSGMAFYDYSSDSFINPAPDIDFQVMCMNPDGSGNLWMGAEKGRLVQYSSGRFNVFDFGSQTGGASLTRIAVSRSGRIFISSYCDDIYYMDSDSEGHFAITPYFDSYFKGDDIGGMVFSKDDDDILYVLGKRCGLCEVNLISGHIRNLYRFRTDQKFTSVRLDASGILWLASTSGLVRYDTASGEVRNISADPGDCFSLSDNNVTCSFEDREGNLWVATAYQGLNCASLSQSRFRKFYRTEDRVSLNMCNIKGVDQDSSGIVWLASESLGLLRFDPSSGSLRNESRRYGLPVMTSVCSDGPYLWLGSRAGIYRINPGSGEKKFYSHFHGGDFRVISLLKLASGTIMAGTTGGVMMYDRDLDSFVKVDGENCLNADVLVQDDRGVVWMATYSDGIYVYDEKCGIRQVGVNEIPKAMSSVAVGGDDVWAMSFGSGFFRYDRSCETFERCDTAVEPSLPSDVCYSAIPDETGNLWLTTDKGMAVLCADGRFVRTFDLDDGLLDEVFCPVSLRLRSGHFLFGSRNGFIVFDPSEILEAGKTADVYISEFVMADGAVRPGKGGPIDRNVNEVDVIHLSNNHNSFSLRLSTPGNLFVRQPVLTRLSGVDAELREVSRNGVVSYYDLHFGSYTLQFFSIDADGEEYEVHKPVRVVIDPPFILSGAGLSLVCLAIFSVVLLVVWYIDRGLRRRHARKIKEFKARKDMETVKEKMELFSGIIREIRTPLTMIRTPLNNLLSDAGMSESTRKELKTIEKSSNALDSLARELNNFIRIEKRGYKIKRSNADIVDRLEFLCYDFSDAAGEAGLDLRFIHSDESHTVALDSAAFDKIITNLLRNAVHYARTAVIVEQKCAGGRVLIDVSNDGPEIPESMRREIFKPFVQLDRGEDTRSFGIGLSLARTLAEAHGGSLTLVSGQTEDESNAFRTVFELALPDYSVPGEQCASDPAGAVGGAKTLMLLEENSSLQDYLRSKFCEDFSVIAPTSLSSALETISRRRVDIVMADIGSDRGGGAELCRRIRSQEGTLSRPELIVVSSNPSENLKIKCLEAGASMYIEKPFTIDYLRACILSVLARHTTETANPLGRDEQFLASLEAVIQRNLSNDGFGVKQLEMELFMSHTALYTRVNALLHTTPVEYIRARRMEAAAKMIRANACSISEICYKVGFTSPSYFTKCFRETFGVTPSRYK